MEKYEERIKRNKKRKRKNAVVVFVSLVLLFSVGFFIGGKMSKNKSNVVVSAANDTKEEPNKKISEETMNKRESQVNENPNNNTNSDGFDPYKEDGKKVAYLTFDDGPSVTNTPKILDILKKNNIKATFFVIGKNAEENSALLKREAEEGHVIGNHTYSHNMKLVYANTTSFVSEFDKGDKAIKSVLGNDYNSKLIRFPGGSFGTKLQPYREAAKKAGYHYIDWNDSTGDAEHNSVPVNNLLNELKTYTTKDHVVILMHDAPAKHTTVEALPKVIEYLQSKGYSFDTLK